jgi:hypothetical protein
MNAIAPVLSMARMDTQDAESPSRLNGPGDQTRVHAGGVPLHTIDFERFRSIGIAILIRTTPCGVTVRYVYAPTYTS